MKNTLLIIYSHIETTLQLNSDPEDKEQFERYLKNVVTCLGVRSPAIEILFKQEYLAKVKPLAFNDQLSLGCALVKSDYFEMKKFGILLLHKNIKHISISDLSLFSKLFAKHIYDWATCDTFSSKVLTRLIKKDNTFALPIAQWKNSSHLWQQRAACISFVGLGRHGNHNEMILSICTQVIKNSERFAQLGVGWVIRELSVANIELALTFIQSHYSQFSREGLRYAIEKLEPTLRKNILKGIFK
ncbi:MAG: DNA alkylation repair protein [Fibrobacterales bacterium]